jgi:CubicO group peptidase (beta-lactamase class C family)
MSFDDYLDENIFEPLDMTRSTFRQPLPERLREHMSKGYERVSEPPKPFEIIAGLAPAGAMSTPGADLPEILAGGGKHRPSSGARCTVKVFSPRKWRTAACCASASTTYLRS